MVAAALAIGVRRKADDANQRVFSLEDVFESLADAAQWVQGEMGALHNRTSLSLVLDQRQYTLANNVQKAEELEYFNSSGAHPIESCTEDQFRNYSRIVKRATIPRRYTHLETEGVLLIDPIPDTAAPTTTINQVGGISATATSVTVAATSSFASEGRIIIDTEVIGYTNKTSTSFTGLARALEGTTAATHANSATITTRNLMIWGQRLFMDMEMRRYYTTGTAAATNNSKTVTGTSTTWNTGNTLAGDYFGTTANVTTTMPTKWYKIDTVDSATQVTLVDAFGEPNYSASTYIISGPNPFPSYCDGMLKSYAASQLLKKTGRFDLANIEFATARSLLATAMQNQKKNDTFLRQRSLSDYFQRVRMPIWMRNQRVS